MSKVDTMSVLSLPWSRNRSKLNLSSLSIQTSTVQASASREPLTPSPTRARNRLRKQPALEKSTGKASRTSPKMSLQQHPAVKLAVKAISPPKITSSTFDSRGTLGGFHSIDDLEREPTTDVEGNTSAIKTVGRKIGLGLRLQNERSTDLTHSVDGEESWYISYPPPTPTYPDTGVQYLGDQDFVESDSGFEAEEDTSSVLSSYTSRASTLSSIYVYEDCSSPVAVETLILSAQNLADQYRNLLSRTSTPRSSLYHLPSQNFDSLTPLPLHITQHPKSKRASRRLSEKKPPIIPARQHFKIPSPKKTLRKVQARHSLHKYVNVSEYQHVFKSSRLSECSTLVSSKENTPIPSPGTLRKEREAFPQEYVADSQKACSPGIRPQRVVAKVENSDSDGILLRVPCVVYDYLGSNEAIPGGLEWEVWI